MENCPHCDAPLKPAATYCLACDRPVVAASSRLSVSEATPVSVGRPLVGLVAIVGAVVVVGALVWGYVAYVQHGNARTATQAGTDVKKGTTLLVAAEGGRSDACQHSVALLAGPAAGVLTQCQAIVGQDPGARIASIRVDRVSLQGSTGTARVRATVDDHSGAHTLDRVVNLVHVARKWRMSWDGRPEI